MLRFTLFRFPVAVHWMFWLNTALISGYLEASSRDQIQKLFTFIAAAFISIIIHELGHAFLMRHYRARASILLYAFGGLAIPEQARFNRRQDIIISLAGPMVQMVVGFMVQEVTPRLTLANYLNPGVIFLYQFSYISIAWAVLNLIPIFPLDGGHVLNNMLGPRRYNLTLKIGIGCAAALALWFLLSGRIYSTLLFGMLAYENVRRLRRERPLSFLDPV
jgi:Zn-dependent protease